MTQTSNTVVTRPNDDITVVALAEAALTEKQINATRDTLLKLGDEIGAGELRLDFAQVTYLDSSALGMLVLLHRRAGQKGGHLVLDNLAPDLYELLKLTRLDTILDARPTE